jgi:regulator of protease activity HflC (stomatin/prohibitin superfamily)
MATNNQNPISPKRIATLVGLGVVFIFCISSISQCGETVGAREIVVKQGFMGGALTIWNSPGFYLQNWGSLTRYEKSKQYWFSAKGDEGTETDDSIKVRFNDGGHAQVSGSLRYDLPSDMEHLMKLHTKYGSMTSIQKDLLRPIVNKSVYMTGPLMSSKESYAERRNDLIQYVEDQIAHGVYKTTTQDKTAIDPLSGHEKTVTIVKIVADPKAPGGLARQETSLLEDFGIRVYGVSITSIDYDPEVEKQIQQQQQAIMQIQLSMAQAKQAEQKAITTAKEGEAMAAKAKWDQETIKAKAVTQAEQEKEVAVTSAEKDRDVAKLKKEAAESTKAEQILLGEGEGARKKAAMLANGALEQKLDAWVRVNEAYAEHFGSQALVPQIQMGSSGGNGTPAEFMNLLMAKTAKDLSLDLTGKK